MLKLKWALLSGFCFFLCQCASSSNGYKFGPANMSGPTQEARDAAIASEPTGDFFYGRRYYVKKTRFWGYLRKPRQSANSAKLVLFKEDRKKAPDRLSESGPASSSYGFDNNYEYRIYGNYTGEEGYDPNSNQFLPIFRITDYKLVDRNPGWLFRPDDHYDPYRVTLVPR
ncbi:hypothetical protein ACFSSA_05905 [Luteolibacter algae]|uniref:Lipoprotein n=1 Tax=Luteolibacter algae TaxID=454151 RepID=A0ABW5D6K9_9BACT